MSHPTLLGLHKEQLQHLVAALYINLLQQKPYSLVTKVHSSSQKNCLAKIGTDGPATMGGELLQARLNIVDKTTLLLANGLSLSSSAVTLCPI